MGQKVVMVLIDGMRADSLAVSGHPFIEQMKQTGSYTLDGQTVMPSVTLPCHMSLFHSVPPERHGIVENVYTAQVRPIPGLYEQLAAQRKVSGHFHNWSELRDLARPGSVAHNCFISGDWHTFEYSNQELTKQAITYIQEHSPDFVFLYLGKVDMDGHRFGWMSDEYIQSVYDSWELVEQVANILPEEYNLIVTSDHGGHDRGHGMNIPEDMTIPFLLRGKNIATGEISEKVSILDIAPTIVDLMDVPAHGEWEGKSLLPSCKKK
ncbi:alkaline phosphatase family protein [Paenibacillus yanchengensis]|uniref:Alkaline phosphatase family protein n=1 Tax=Paenibacillus yanchengensis TaxID=2035833 RepID=A0ABW4YFC2_9BACL